MLKDIANAFTTNHPKVFTCLAFWRTAKNVDRNVKEEVVATIFGQQEERRIKIYKYHFGERKKMMIKCGCDVDA